MMKFQEWVAFVFDHPVGGDEPWYKEEYRKPDLSVGEITYFMTRTFTDCGEVFKEFSNDQIANGLYFLTNPKASDYIRAVSARELDIETRASFLSSIETLYRDCFAPNIEATLWQDLKSYNHLNHICYQFWTVNDLPILLASMGKKKKDSGDIGQRSIALQHVFNAILSLPNIACVESALQGLSVAQEHVPKLVEQIISEFLSLNGSRIPIPLLTYAKDVRKGHP